MENNISKMRIRLNLKSRALLVRYKYNKYSIENR